MKLLVTPRPHVGECHRAYPWRLAALNGLSTPRQLIKSNSLKSRVDLETLYEENLRPEYVEMLASQRNRCDDRYILKSGFRVCSACYKGTPCILEEWQYALMPYCRIHGTPLCDVSKISLLTWSSSDARIWSKSAKNVPNKHVLELQSVLGSALGFIQKLNTQHDDLVRLSADQLHRLVVLIGAFGTAGDRFQPRKVPFKADPNAACSILLSSADCLSKWPEGIDSLLVGLTNRKLESRSVRRNVGSLYGAIQKSLRDAEFKFFRDAFYKAIKDEWPEVMDSKSQAAKSNASSVSRYVSGTVFAREMGVSTDTVSWWIESKRIGGSIRLLDNGRRQLSVRSGQNRKARKLVQSFCLIEASQHLGLKKETVRGLIQSGDVKAFRSRPTAPWEIDKQQISSLIKNLREGAGSSTEMGNLKSLDEIMRFYASSDVTQIMIISAIMCGELVYSYEDRPMKLSSKIHIDRRDFITWALPADLVTIPELAKELRIKQEVAYHIVNVGLISTIDKGRFGRVVSRDHLSEFNDKYVWARDLASSARCSPKKIVEILAASDIRPASGPGVDGGRQFLYVRDETEAQACIKQRSGF